MEHLTIEANGASFHVARTGAGRPLLLLHGWPEFWLTWEPVMKRLADRYTLIAPDLRGFGDSAKPAGPFGPADHATDMLALLDALGVARVGVIGHDGAGAVRRAVFLRLRLSRHRPPDGGARPAQRDLVPILQPDGDGASPGRRNARQLPHVHRAFPAPLVAPRGGVRRCDRSLHRQLPEVRQSRRRFCPLSRRPRRPDQHD